MAGTVYYKSRKVVVTSSEVTIDGFSYDLSMIQDATIDTDDMNRHAFIGTVGAASVTLVLLFGLVAVILLLLVVIPAGSLICLPKYTVILKTRFGRIQAFKSVRKGKAAEVLQAITAARDDMNRALRYASIGAVADHSDSLAGR